MNVTSTERKIEKQDQSIVVTDSGLGGLSVFNELVGRLEKNSPWARVRLTYVNAWPAPHRGYNHFKRPERKVRVFNNAMESMRQFDPDQILIACNTLSVIYPETRFSKISGIPVQGIVDHGVRMLFEKLDRDPESVCVILGTPMTTQARSHEKGLVQLGISESRIINTGCTNLAGWIERTPFDDEIPRMIERFAKQTGEKLEGFSGNVYTGLCCTHFGYRQELFQKAFDRFVPGNTSFLNPNVRMAEQTVEKGKPAMTGPASIEIRVVSQAEWSRDQIRACFDLMPDMPERLRDALELYKLDKNLFSTD